MPFDPLNLSTLAKNREPNAHEGPNAQVAARFARNSPSRCTLALHKPPTPDILATPALINNRAKPPSIHTTRWHRTCTRDPRLADRYGLQEASDIPLLLSLEASGPQATIAAVPGAFKVASRQARDRNGPAMAIFKELPVLNAPDRPLARPLSPSQASQILNERKPEWLKIRPPGGERYTEIKGMLRERSLHTVCEEAHCPNLSECWASGTATFMLGSDVCTRACRFCAIKTSRTPPPLDPLEPAKIAESVAALKLKYVVLTSVDRDDMKDGGATHFAETIREIKRLDPSITVEALVPDFRGDAAAVKIIVDSGLDVYAHNIETVRRLQYRVRDPRAGYVQSLETLRVAKLIAQESGRAPLFTKSAVMLGLGESELELNEAFADLRLYDVDVLTIGQYLRPSATHLPVEKYYSPAEFDRIGEQAREKGFLYVASGPMVRSSYRAAELFLRGQVDASRSATGATRLSTAHLAV